jgi:hypothetical protein
MWLFASVCSDMSRLVFQSVESLLAQRTLVGPWEVLSVVFLDGLSILQHRSHKAHGRGRHLVLVLVTRVGARDRRTGLRSRLREVLVLIGGSLRVQ